jgi:hypothetical protein
MRTFRKLNNLLGLIIFTLASWVYLSTIEPTASWWDCGEYISTAFKLQVGHPPGAPLFQMLGRFFSLFAFGDVSKVAMMVNIMSALCSSATILFLFWSITMLGLKFTKDEEISTGRMYAILGSGLVGALAYTFSDSFWFSAVEGEVYAMSSFFTAIVFWAILKWDQAADQPHSQRWIILIAYLMGLSIGVHLLNLLAIPAIALVFYFRKYKTTWKGVAFTLGISFFILSFIMFLVIPYTVSLAGKYEILFVNSFGLPFNTGTLFYFLVLIGSLAWSIRFTYQSKHSKPEYIIGGVLMLLLAMFSWVTFFGSLLVAGAYYWYKNNPGRTNRNQVRSAANTVFLSIAFLLVGYSSFFLLVIRANTNTPINENDPSDAVSLLSYLNREQYGSWPIVYGQYYNAPNDRENPGLDGNPVYIKDVKKGKYIITDDKKSSIPNYDSRFCTIFPRMWSSDTERQHPEAYKSWGKVKGVPLDVVNSEGKTETRYRPTFVENMRFFFSYQIDHMYLRYFFWNFAGRQNDIQGEGGIQNGNWISGIPFIDNARLGEQSNLPDSMKNAARNKFYMFPFLLGLLGMYFHLRKHRDGFLVVLLLFFMTGIAIVLYLNTPPNPPRERDYAFAGSFYAYAMWIGLGVMALWDLVRKYAEKYSPIFITIAGLILVPGIMAKEGWDDHDRSDKFAARDFAVNYLNSCAPNAILITNGDNDTFPLWYAQEVEGIRTDVRVVNFTLASGDWYVHQLMRKIYKSDTLPFTLSYEQYNKGVNDVLYHSGAIKDRVELQDLIDYIASDDPASKYNQDGTIFTLFPANKVKITLDSALLVKEGSVPKKYADKILSSLEFDIRTSYIAKNDLMLLDFLAKNKFKRPVYFVNPASIRSADFTKFCYLNGFVYRFLPLQADTADQSNRLGFVDAESSYNILMNKCKWGNLASPDVYVDPESFRNTFAPKQNFMRLAKKLVAEGKNDQAIKVVDYVQQIFPDNKIHFDYYMVEFVNTYYAAGAFDKGNKLANRLLQIYEQNLGYISRLSPEFRGNYEEDHNIALSVIDYLKQMATQYNQPAITGRIEKYQNTTKSVN